MRNTAGLRFSSFAFLAAALFVAGSAQAVPVFYGELKTSTLLGNQHLELTTQLPTSISSVAAVLSSSSVNVLGTGLGSGLVEAPGALTITHTFAPDGYNVGQVKSASLFVSIVDDMDIAKESATVDIGSLHVGDGSSAMLYRLFGGSVLALVDSIGDTLTFTVTATSGDFKVASSLLAVSFDGTRSSARVGTTSPLPEPTAALVFGLGVALIARRRVSA